MLRRAWTGRPSSGPPESSFQFGLLAHEAGYREEPHFHKPVPSNDRGSRRRRSSSSQGVVDVELYTDDRRLFREIRLQPGDAIVLIHGIHAIRVVEHFQALSVKQGPFLGDEEDKVLVEATMIPVFEPSVGDEEAAAVAAAVRGGEISGTFGEELPGFEREEASLISSGSDTEAAGPAARHTRCVQPRRRRRLHRARR